MNKSVWFFVACFIALFVLLVNKPDVFSGSAITTDIDRELIVSENFVDFELLYIRVAQKYVNPGNLCGLAAVGEYTDVALKGLTPKSIRSSFEAASKGSVNLEKIAYDLSLGRSVLNIKTNTLRIYDSDHRSGDINFITKNCKFN